MTVLQSTPQKEITKLWMDEEREEGKGIKGPGNSEEGMDSQIFTLHYE